jgi:hypothetical protein
MATAGTNGCDYGKGTRWAVGLLAALMGVVLVITMSVCVQVRGESAQDVASLRQEVSARAIDSGRLEERLAGLDRRLEGIESSLEKLTGR